MPTRAGYFASEKDAALCGVWRRPVSAHGGQAVPDQPRQSRRTVIEHWRVVSVNAIAPDGGSARMGQIIRTFSSSLIMKFERGPTNENFAMTSRG